MEKLIPVDVSQLFKYFLVILFCFSTNIFSQPFYNQIAVSTKDLTRLQEKPIQYRRGIALQEGYQSYEQYYSDKNLTEEKRSLFPLESTGIWTELNPKVPRVDYFGIQFVNKDTGWAVGNLGALIKSTDGGQSWTVIQTNTTKPILKVRSFNGQIVIASGFDGLILRSTNAGETFTQITSGVTGDMWGLQMLNDTLGWACGNVNSLIKTTDGGQSWQRIFTPGYTSDYWWLEFLNENYGFIAGNGYVLRTSDGGINWDIIPAGDSYPLFCLDVIDSLHIAAAGYGGTNYSAKNLYSSNGGNTWLNGGDLTTEAVNCIQYINPDTGYLVMNERYYRKTTNRGQEWSIVLNEIGEFEFQFLFNNNIGYSAGTGLQISKSENNFDVWHRLIINDEFKGVFFTNENIGYTIAYRRVLKTIDGGLNWSYLSAFPTNQFTSALNSITFTDSITGFAGGPPCRIAKTTDAGYTWYQTSVTGLSDTIGSINKIFFINKTTGWAVTTRGGILKTTDSGENWFAQLNAGISVIFNSICFIDSLYGWTANSNSRPYKTTDGGNIWVQQTNLNIWQGRDVFFNDYLSGFILESNKLYRTIDGGTNFNLISDVTGFSIAAKFSYYSDSTIFITGYRTYRSIDAGNTWIDFPELTGTKITGLSLLSRGYGYASGELGLIMRYNDTSVPVELTSFTFLVNENNVKLNWQTATETNNLGFQVERRKTQDERSKEWETIGFVEGNGTTTEPHSYSFADENLQVGKYQYMLKQIDYDGSFEYSKIIEVNINIPDKFLLEQNYPNPFNPLTKIEWQTPLAGFNVLKIYDVLGSEVKTLVDEFLEAGKHSIDFNASGLSSGIYFYKLNAGGNTYVRKMILLQ